jgi:phenylacetate-coenzyme A ligase PaaK-like adenylate-forming protein
VTPEPATDPIRLAGELFARRSWSRERLLSHQRRALRALVAHAATESPYYRETLGSLANEDEVSLEDLPALPKSVLMDEWDRVVTDPRLRLADVEEYLTRDGLPEPFLGEYHVFTTGGSTGLRGVFVNSRDDFTLTMAGMLRPIIEFGISPEMRLLSIGSPSPFHLSNQVFAALRAGRTGSPPLDVTMPLERLVAAANAYRPDVIVTYPSILRLLAEEQLGGRLAIEPTAAGTGSEALSDEVRERARKAWGIEVFDVYVSTEGGMMAGECPERCGRHVWEDVIILEPVDEHNRPVPAGTPSHRVLLTNLWCRTQPLIRYELADSVTFAEGPNPTGRPYERIERIEGRSDDILRLPALAGGDVSVHPFHLRAPFGHLPEVRQYQIQRSEDALRVRIVVDVGAGRDVPARVETALIASIEAAGAVPPRVEVEPVDEIARTGAGAKLTLVA